ncbi:hypothetical protein GCM10009623_34650 [Nocardioides aestuarii]
MCATRRPHREPPKPDLHDELWTVRHLATFLHCGRTTAFATAAVPGFPKALTLARGRGRLWAADEVRAWVYGTRQTIAPATASNPEGVRHGPPTER